MAPARRPGRVLAMTNLMAHPTSTALVDALRNACVGEVTGPGDAGYDTARQAWNLAADQRPAAVVRAALLADLAATVRVAREHGLRVAPQGTGHGAGALGPLDAAILLRTDELRGVSVDPQARVARVQAGAQWNDVLAESAPHGLAPLAGSAGMSASSATTSAAASPSSRASSGSRRGTSSRPP